MQYVSRASRRVAALCRQQRTCTPFQARANASPAGGRERFAGKACVVTGGASGIGKAAAALFAREGGDVLVVDKNDENCRETAKELCVSIRAGCAVPFTADVSSETDNAAIVEACLAQFGSLDVFFANAGTTSDCYDLQESTASSFEKILKVNLLGPFLAVKYASQAMRGRGGGAIVITASIASIRATISPVEYHASKAGVMGVIRAAQESLLEDGIRVNGVAPGAVPTPLALQEAMNYQKRGLEVVGFDIARFPFIDPEEVAQVVAFLACSESSAIKGQMIVVDRGWTNSTGVKFAPLKTKS